MAAPYPIRPGEADCRDYLRTGRCKYGDSCKYNHPLNVESGGGVKPTNPSEPLFPIRPTEPACQYFLKHGTCKFGQSCKFNHPHESALTNGGSCIPAGQLVFVTANPSRHMPGDATSHLMAASSSVQVLPQRPTEPNCIYFLRNGKCKYGATCKFHHPLDAMNRNNQVQFIPTANVRTSQNSRDRSLSSGSMPEGRPPMQVQVQHNGTYATSTNISYVQPQRLQSITERVRPQQPTHVLLPDGQIAVILDQQSLQNVSELSVQDRPKFYLSQTDGSIGTLPHIDHTNNNVVVSSPMLTATTGSASTQTFDSSLDLMGNNASYQVQVPGTVSRGPNKSGSGGSLSAYGSLDSEFCQPVSSHNISFQQQPSAPCPPSSFPQYSAWPITEVAGEANLPQMPLSGPGGADVVGQRLATNNLKSTDENTSYYWPSSSSIAGMPVAERDVQAGLPYISNPNSSSYGSSSAAGQAVCQSYSGERKTSLPTAASSDQIRSRNEGRPQPRASSGDDCEGLTMMTSALLTMMDRHGSPSGEGNVDVRRSPAPSPYAGGSRKANTNDGISQPSIGKENKIGVARAISCQSEPNLRGASPIRPPPGMMSAPPGMPSIEPSYTSNYDREQTSSKSPPGGGYFLGGYDQAPPRSPPWGN